MTRPPGDPRVGASRDRRAGVTRRATCPWTRDYLGLREEGLRRPGFDPEPSAWGPRGRRGRGGPEADRFDGPVQEQAAAAWGRPARSSARTSSASPSASSAGPRSWDTGTAPRRTASGLRPGPGPRGRAGGARLVDLADECPHGPVIARPAARDQAKPARGGLPPAAFGGSCRPPAPADLCARQRPLPATDSPDMPSTFNTGVDASAGVPAYLFSAPPPSRPFGAGGGRLGTLDAPPRDARCAWAYIPAVPPALDLLSHEHSPGRAVDLHPEGPAVVRRQPATAPHFPGHDQPGATIESRCWPPSMRQCKELGGWAGQTRGE